MRNLRLYGIGIILLVLGAIAVACGGTSSGVASNATDSLGGSRTDEGGNVTVKVTWNGRLQPFTFRVALDTHSVNLDTYDLTSLAVLRTDRGELKPSGWDAPKGGHHREGNLAFDPASSIVAPGATYLELAVSGIGDKSERVFRWDLVAARGGQQ